MERASAVIVDDEEGARDVLSHLLSKYCQDIELIAAYTDLEKAVLGIKKLKPKLVFLDIEMPKYAGYEIANFFTGIDFEIIFVTAYDNYAIKAFELAAIDYLLKPIDIARLQKSCTRVMERVSQKEHSVRLRALESNLHPESSKKMVIKVKGHEKIFSIDEIVAIEAKEAYSYIHLVSEERHMVSKNLKHFERLLEDNTSFFRTHKSWMVNLEHLENRTILAPEVKMKGGLVAKLSKYKKAEFKSKLIS